MAYGEQGKNARLLLSTVRNAANFSGRARRTELVCYWIAVTLISVVIGFATFGVLPWGKDVLVSEVARAPLAIPLFALFARRMHDQNRSGWWTLLIVASILLSIPDFLRWTQTDPMQLLAYEQSGPHPLRWVSATISILAFTLSLWPGTVGPNKFGPDPREEE